MASTGVTNLKDAVTKFLSVNMKNKFFIKRSYDDWTFKQLYSDRKRRAHCNAQSLNPDLHARMGSDLAVSNFIIGIMGGRIKDQRGIWINKLKDLPPDYSKTFKLIAVDGSKNEFVFEGLDNFVGLNHLESLDLSRNPELDDFACDQLSRQFRFSKTLKSIDLSYNTLISIYGLEILMQIPSLRHIRALKTSAINSKEIDLFILTAEDECQCSIHVHDDRQLETPQLKNLQLKSRLSLAAP